MNDDMFLHFQVTFDCVKFRFLRVETVFVGKWNVLVCGVLCRSSHIHTIKLLILSIFVFMLWVSQLSKFS